MQSAGDPAGAKLGVCYANTPDPGVIGHAAMSLDGTAWVFSELDGAAATPAPAAATPAAPAAATANSFGDGNLIVGTDVAPGTYTTSLEGDPNCWIETFSDLTAEESIEYVYASEPGTYFFEVTADAAIVNSSDCGTWTLVQQ